MPMPSVYVETSIVSYLTALRSRDIVRAAQQELTRAWWTSRGDFELLVSRFVTDEASAGDPGAAHLRVEALRGIRRLGITEDAAEAARARDNEDDVEVVVLPPKLVAEKKAS